MISVVAIRALHAKGLTDRQIGLELGLDRSAVGQVRRRIGLPCNPGRFFFSEEQEAIIRRDYRRVPSGVIAAAMGKTVAQIYAKASAMGISTPPKIKAPDFVAFLTARNAAGWSDSEIARVREVDRHAVTHMRRKLGLPFNGFSQWRIDRVRGKTAVQLLLAGVKSLGELRAKVLSERSVKAGWPAGLKSRQVDILNLLWENGPMTREQIGATLGLHKKPKCGKFKSRANGERLYWYPMHCNTPGHGADTSYMADLLRRGLIVSLGRIVRHKRPGPRGGQGRNTFIYSLSLWLERKPHGQTVKSG
jgi:hypothetical protein